MKGSAIFKAKKLLKISLEHDGQNLQAVAIHGDFFMYPEEKIGELEKALEGTALEKPALVAKITDFLKTATAFGFEPDDLAAAILMAAGKGDSK